MRFLPFVVLLVCLPGLAHAQLVLPGAVNAPPEKAVKLPGQSSAPAKPKVVYAPIPGEDAVIGRALNLNGSSGLLEISKTATGLSISKLTMAGNMISRPGDSCQVQVVASPTVSPLTLEGKPEGILRYQNAIPACKFTLDVLKGAVIVKAETEICKFAAADCQVRPNGMWGPNGRAISSDQISSDLSARPQAENALRASYKSLMERNPATMKSVVSEQAAFSSLREEMCRDYAMETKHGFCDTRFTEAKVANVRMRLGEKTEVGEAPPKKRHKKKHSDSAPPLTMEAPAF